MGRPRATFLAAALVAALAMAAALGVAACDLHYGGRVPAEEAAAGRRCSEDLDCRAGLRCFNRRCRILCEKGCPAGYACEGEAEDGTLYCKRLPVAPLPSAVY